MMANIKIKNKKVLAVIIAFAMVLGLVAPIVVSGAGIFGGSWIDQQDIHVDYTPSPDEQNYFVTNKSLTPLEDEKNAYNVRLEAYATNNKITVKPADIVLVIDGSLSMKETLYQRYRTNLNTHPLFTKVALSGVTHDNLFVDNNPLNETLSTRMNEIEGRAILSSVIGLLPTDRPYRDNQYIEDPTAPGTYVPLSQTYSVVGEKNKNGYLIPALIVAGNFYTYNKYDYSFTASNGHIYHSDSYTLSLNNVINNTKIGTLTFHDTATEDKGPDYTTNSIYTFNGHAESLESYNSGNIGSVNLTDVNNAYCLKLWRINNPQGKKLYIIDDNNQEVEVTVAGYTSSGTVATPYTDITDIVRFDFRCVDSVGVEHIAVQGNEIYGAKNSVFQGFKQLKAKNGKFVVDHENSIESTTLYQGETNLVNVSRMDALKEAVERYLLLVHKNAYEKGVNQKVAVVAFNTKANLIGVQNDNVDQILELTDLSTENVVASAIDAVYNIVPAGGTPTDKGMQEALNILKSDTDVTKGNRNSNVILFTDGVPSSGFRENFSRGTSISLDITKSNNAITASNTMKKSYGTKVYTVGMFGGTNTDQLYGDQWLYADGSTITCTGKKGSYWGGSWLARAIGVANDFEQRDIAANNRLLNYLSSNYAVNNQPTAINIRKDRGVLGMPIEGLGLKPKWYKLAGKGYQVTVEDTRKKNYDKYYMSVFNQDDLSDVFEDLAVEMYVSSAVLSERTVLKDTITQYFEMNDSVSDIDAHVERYSGGSWSRTSDKLTVSLSDDKKEVQVTGFPYTDEGNYFNGTSGEKVVVEFKVYRDPNLIAGYNIPSNGSDSAVYDYDGALVESFAIPLVNFDVDYEVETADQSIYISEHTDLASLIDVDQLNGYNNKFVDITYTIRDSENNIVGTYTVPAGTDITNRGTLIEVQNYDEEGNPTTVDHVRAPDGNWVANTQTGSTATNDPANTLSRYPQLSEDETYSISYSIKLYDMDGNPVNDKQFASSEEKNATVYVFSPQLEVINASGNVGAAAYDLTPTVVGWTNSNTDSAPDHDAPDAIAFDIKNNSNNSDVSPDQYQSYTIFEDTEFGVVGIRVTGTEFSFYGEHEEQATFTDESTGRTYSMVKDSTGVEGYVDGNKFYYEDESQQNGVGNRNVKTGEVFTPVMDLVYTNANDAAREVNAPVKVRNTSDEKTDGTFLRTVNRIKMIIGAEFAGDYANPEDVTYTVTDEDGKVVGTASFSKDDFSGLKLKEDKYATIENLAPGKNYTVTKTSGAEKYIVTFTAKDSGDFAVNDADNDLNNQQFVMNYAGDNDTVNIMITNTFDEQCNPPVSGIDGGTNLAKLVATIMFLLAGILGVGEVSYIAYLRVKS